MAPTIRIDDDLYAYLQEHAQPFVDSPNTVLRRLLGFAQNGSKAGAPLDEVPGGSDAPHTDTPAGSRSPKRRRAPRGTLLPHAEYELPLLQVLDEAGGRAPASEAIDAIEPKLADKLTEADRQPTDSGEVRWRNRTAFARLGLVQSGHMKKDSPRGVWELTEKGAKRARSGSR